MTCLTTTGWLRCAGASLSANPDRWEATRMCVFSRSLPGEIACWHAFTSRRKERTAQCNSRHCTYLLCLPAWCLSIITNIALVINQQLPDSVKDWRVARGRPRRRSHHPAPCSRLCGFSGPPYPSCSASLTHQKPTASWSFVSPGPVFFTQQLHTRNHTPRLPDHDGRHLPTCYARCLSTLLLLPQNALIPEGPGP